jgi:hypothetical protein
MVKTAWDAFEKNLLKPETQLKPKHFRNTPRMPIEILAASSGAPMPDQTEF